MRAIVTGCARSGTTMMIHLMQYFYNTKAVINDEVHPFDYDGYNHKDHILVIKKPYLEPGNVEYFSLTELIQKGWFIIWMLRDGKDVICSKLLEKYHVEPDRWIYANSKMLENLFSKQVIVVRYEKLVNQTHVEMLRIGKFIGQDFQTDFDEWWKNVNSENPMNTGMVPRPITSESIGNFKNHTDRISAVAQNQNFEKLLNILGYERV
jgi:hypothetical protein